MVKDSSPSCPVALAARVLAMVGVATPVAIAAVLESYCHLSGDLFGWEARRDGKFLIWIVDMAGHGLRAGLASAILRTLVTNLIVGNSLLCAAGFPMCGEYDIKTCVAMLIMDRLDIGGSFAEFHPIVFTEGFVLVGHDGPHHLNIAEGRPVLRRDYAAPAVSLAAARWSGAARCSPPTSKWRAACCRKTWSRLSVS